MKTRRGHTYQIPRDWRMQWAPIFRAAREGRLPNRLGAVLEMMQCQCALRQYRVERRGESVSR